MTAQRILAAVLTVLLFAIVILGFGLIFNLFGQYVIGLVVGAVFCALMVVGFVRDQRKGS